MLGTKQLEDFFLDLGLQELVNLSRSRDREVNELNIKVPYKPELIDLYRLYSMVTTTNRTTVVEFGVGWSSLIFALALENNRSRLEGYVKKNLRRNNPFELHSIDNEQPYMDIAQARIPNQLQKHVFFHHTEVDMVLWNGRVATEYRTLPIVSPDFIYLDAPDQFQIHGDINGINIGHKDMMPMSCDILKIEHFLTPGTLIVIDGRAANARFLKTNLQRHWRYSYEESYDQHVLLLDEEPLGPYNKRQLQMYNK